MYIFQIEGKLSDESDAKNTKCGINKICQQSLYLCTSTGITSFLPKNQFSLRKKLTMRITA